MTAVPELARLLDLEPHSQGGWYRRTYACEVPAEAPGRGTRPAATLILYLLPPGERAAWHTVASDEMWLWHRGGPLLLRTRTGDGEVAERLLGPDVESGQRPQLLVPAGTAQSAEPATEREVLVGCLEAPGFDFADFRLL